MTPSENGNGKPRKLSKQELEQMKDKQRAALEAALQGQTPDAPFEPRCDACTSPYRQFIDTMLIRGASYSSIAEQVPGVEGKRIDRRSVSNHAKKHLGFQETAIRALLEEESNMADQNFEEGVRGAITHRGVLEIMVRKAYDDIINGLVEVEPKDLISTIQVLQKMDERSESIAVDELRAQVSAFIQAIKEETDRETWERISIRTKRILGQSIEQPAIPATVAE